MTNKDVLLDLNDLIASGKEDEAFKKYPRNFLIYGERIKSRQSQKRNFFKTQVDPHIWLHGFPGSGKTTLLKYIYPNSYKKKLDNRFFDLYDPEIHTHTILEDLDPVAVERLGSNFLKTICDSTGFPIDQKYKACHLARTVVLVSSNYCIRDVFAYEEKGREQTIGAMERRFYQIRIDNLLRFLGLKLIDKYDQKALLAKGNEDLTKLFIDWDYMSDTPTGEDIQSPEFYQKAIAAHYYGQEGPTRKKTQNGS